MNTFIEGKKCLEEVGLNLTKVSFFVIVLALDLLKSDGAYSLTKPWGGRLGKKDILNWK